MAGKDMYDMSQEDRKRLHVVKKIEEGLMKQVEGAQVLGLVDRQIRRIVARVREEGERGIIHRLRGRQSNRAYSTRIREKILSRYKERYNGFGPQFASEKLEECDHLRIHPETLRLWLMEEKSEEWEWRRDGRKHRKKRERKHRYGEMVQLDGSRHDWLEGRGPWLVLMGYIDDATGEVYAKFFGYEGTIPAMDSFKGYVRKHGIPGSIYFDKHSTYKSFRKLTVEEELLNQEALTQFGRALKELGVELIHANSPQAKGRVERLFRTFQDRLVKELRLANIRTVEAANDLLKAYIPKFNKRFGVPAIQAGDLHRAVQKGLDLDSILCRKTERALRNDFTVMHDRKIYQVEVHTKAMKVIVEERINGRMYITYKGTRLRYREITRGFIAACRRQKQVKKHVTKTEKPIVPYKPSSDHPWRQLVIKPYKQRDIKRNTVLTGDLRE